MTTNTQQIINDKLCDLLGIQRGDALILDNSLYDAYGMDSLDIIEFVMELEDVFAIEIPDEDAARLATLGEIVRYVDSRITRKKGPLTPTEWEIREAVEVYQIPYPGTYRNRIVLAMVWDATGVTEYVAKRNQARAGRFPTEGKLHIGKIRLIFIQGQWYPLMRRPACVSHHLSEVLPTT